MDSRYCLRCFLAMLALFMPLAVLAEEHEDALSSRLKFFAGTSASTFNSDIRVDSKQFGKRASINLEDDLNYSEDVTINYGYAYFRVADRHRISIEHLPLRRNTDYQIEEDIDFEEDTILAGAKVGSDFDTIITDINYIYSVYKSPRMEIGVSAGIYWMGLEFSVNASGLIRDENGEVEFDEDYTNKTSVDAPVPLFGLTFDYMIKPRWYLGAGVRYLYVPTIEFAGTEYDGRIISASIGTEYYFFKGLGLGVALGAFDLNVAAEGGSFRGEVNWAYEGVQVYGALKF